MVSGRCGQPGLTVALPVTLVLSSDIENVTDPSMMVIRAVVVRLTGLSV